MSRLGEGVELEGLPELGGKKRREVPLEREQPRGVVRGKAAGVGGWCLTREDGLGVGQ